MKQLYLLIIFSLAIISKSYSADSLQNRIIFIGDAGSLNTTQQEVLNHALTKVLDHRTTVVFLGNNVLPDGVSQYDGDALKKDTEILSRQFKPFSDKGIPVYFVPGEADWDNSGPDGLKKIKSEWRFLEKQKDSLVHLLPKNGCPDPVAINVSDNLVMVFMDTEWWLYGYNKDNPEADCDCGSERDIEIALRALFYDNRNKTILLVTHHPLMSYGRHGGYFSWKDHIFPLTHLVPDLYLPLPGVGSLYPLFKKAFPGPQDLRHPVYKDMEKNIQKIIASYPNVFVVSSHDDGLQLIENKNKAIKQIVSGVINGQNYTKSGKFSLFNSSAPGYVIADWTNDQNLNFSFYGIKKDSVTELYHYKTEKQPYNQWYDSLYQGYHEDSIIMAVHPAYNKMGKFGRFWLGNNFRAEWAAPVKLPVISLSKVYGGLKPEKLGGGFQSTSLRLINPEGREYVLRSVEKSPDRVVPEELRSALTTGLLDDAFSAQHPYSALMVPPVAEAVGVPHAHPIIGVVAPDTALGIYQSLFVGRVNLLEEREPLPGTDNFIKAEKKMDANAHNTYDGLNFLKARMIDLLMADWDRHGDQWRFHDTLKGKNKNYLVVPRDRDQVLNLTEGIIPWLGKHLFMMPRVYGFKERLLPGAKFYLYKNNFLSAYPAGQISYVDWMKAANEFKDKVTDSVLTASVATLPKGLNKKRNAEILKDLKGRRNQIPEAMKVYYNFSNKIVDIHASNSNEFFAIEGLPDSNALKVSLLFLKKSGKLGDTIMSKVYPRRITKEIRIYLFGGRDSVWINNPKATIKVRIIGGEGNKSYDVVNAKKKVKLYESHPGRYFGMTEKLKKHTKADSANIAFIPVNLYSTSNTLLTGSINPDDGISLGLGQKFLLQNGFRKVPFTSSQSILLAHSFSTSAYSIKYIGEWQELVGKANLVINLDVKAPDNTQNFFGVGNQTAFNKFDGFARFYRARFDLYHLNTALRWRWGKANILSIGPSFEVYRFDREENEGRFIMNSNELNSSDSDVIANAKFHLGAEADYTLDLRDDHLFPAYGILIRTRLVGFRGLNASSGSFGQIAPEISFYKNLNPRKTIVLANRIGGAYTVGKPSFYQYAYLGGQDNLMGFRRYRFAGMQSFYNNLELRMAFSNFGNYLMKGQIGILGFYDIGRVWAPNEDSRLWHQGAGGGIFFIPAGLAVFSINMGYSKEGLYPFFKFGFRF